MTQIKHQHLGIHDIDIFSKRDQDYLKNPSRFSSFLSGSPTIHSFEQTIRAKNAAYRTDQRETLVDELHVQAQSIGRDDGRVHRVIESLKSDQAYAVVTAHQPCLFGGPAYFIYKIASAISLAAKLSRQYLDNEFVPMYVMGSEDHDFAEINHLHLFNRQISWQTDQTGAVGRMQLDRIESVIAEVEALLGSTPHSVELITKLKSCYSAERNLSQATADFVYSIFEQHDVVVVDLDQKQFKEQAKHLFWQELTDQFVFSAATTKQKEIKDLGYDPQLYVREINLFHIADLQRSRIEQKEGHFFIGMQSLTSDEMKAELNRAPERFSPNAALRPLFQQFVLPAIAYVGGGAEVAYWMEVSGSFPVAEVPFPILVRRDSAHWIHHNAQKLMVQVNMTALDISLSTQQLQDRYLTQHVEDEWSLDESRSVFLDAFQQLETEVEAKDAGLTKMMKGHQAQHENFVDKLEARLKKAIKSKHEVSMNRIDKAWNHFYPAGQLQERYSNFMEIYAKHGDRFINLLVAQFDPLTPGLHIFSEES